MRSNQTPPALRLRGLDGLKQRIMSTVSAAPPRQRMDNSVPLSTTALPSPQFDAASMGRRLSPWVGSRLHINTQLGIEGGTLRARSRALIANNPYGSNASEVFASYAAGTGIVPSPLLASTYKKRIVDAFTEWTDEADADGLTDFYGLIGLAARALFDAGEVFIRFRDRRPTDGLSVPFQLQLIESEQLDPAYTVIGTPGTTNPIRQGIEFDAIGRRVAYWFWQTHPGDYTLQNYQSQRVRVPADQVLHLFKPLRPGQIRGKPWITPAMVKMYDLDRYEDAELTRKQGAAMFMAFIEQDAGEDIGSTGLVNDDTVADLTGTAEVAMEPGLTHILPAGHKVHFNEPADVGAHFEPFMYRSLLTLCSAMGLPYFAVTGDTSKANYSSLRSALLEVKRRIEQFQWQVLIFQMCRPTYRHWMDSAVLAGTIKLPGYGLDPRKYWKVKWITPKWDWVDPLKDMQAEKVAVDAGFKARSDVIESMGEDPEDVDARIAADHAREKKLGLVFAVGIPKNPDPVAGTDIQPAGGDASGGEGDTTSGDQQSGGSSDGTRRQSAA